MTRSTIRICAGTLVLSCQAGSRFQGMMNPGTIDVRRQDQEQGDEHGNEMQQSDVLV
ncbi:MAG: hypothetical protein ACLQU9_00880 [Acidimicrobiales bacterium]|jgi:hypothetical protein